MRFTKMQGLGNDYIYVDCFRERVDDPPALARAMSRPHFGVGADGLICIGPSDRASVRMRMFNADGSESPMCGNGARCVARYAVERGLAKGPELTIETGGGVRPARVLPGADVEIDMGAPRGMLRDGARTLVDVGNPHAVLMVDFDPFAWEDFDAEGRRLCAELDANVEFVRVLSAEHLQMRVWERGSGETLACGTGACASLAAAASAGLCARRAAVSLRGGDLAVDWRPDGHLMMTGPAVTVFEGEWPDNVILE